MKAFLVLLLSTTLGFVWVLANSHESQRTPAGNIAAKQVAATTLAVEKGIFSVRTYWSVADTTELDVLAGELTFTPNAKATCEKFSFVQTARMQKEDQSDVQWTQSEAPRNDIIDNGYYVDHQAALCQKGKSCSAYFEDSWSNSGANHSGGLKTPSTLTDYPFGWTDFAQIQLESCVVCRSTKDILGCVSWGARWPSVGDREIFTPTATNQPSQTFSDALATFKKYYGCDKVDSCL